jgi:hypothetical protein
MRTAAILTITVCLPLAADAELRQFGVPALQRPDFNRLAAQTGSPLFWVADTNKDGLVDANELGATGRGKPLSPFVSEGQLTPRFTREYKALVELRRREAVARELDGSRPTLVETDLSALPGNEKTMLKQLLDSAWTIEELYLHQTGGFRYRRAAAALDPASRAQIWRNHGPWCETPAAKNDPFCSGSADFPPKRSEAYPSDLVQDDALCKMIQGQANAKDLLDPFTVVQHEGGRLTAVPLHHVFGKQMKRVAARLKAAAGAITGDPGEKALHRYLLAAAQGFETNKWAEADEAWVAMNSENSKWYVRIAPDEVYFDPCQQKAGFHLSLARIDQQSREWQRKLTPLRAEMEQSMAALVGPPYKARAVTFQMPDFIHVVLNAGDSRHSSGGTIGQSLPNWGKVAQEGRGRTVVMSNLYTDEDSKRVSRLQAAALLSKDSMAHHTSNPEPNLVGTILHEAAHNLGPHSDYQIKGKAAAEHFGGHIASTLEELKAQTASLWYLPLLRQKGILSDAQVKQAYTVSITWAFGHISRGMFTSTGNVQPYSQLSAIQIGSFVEGGALAFQGGKFAIHLDKLPAAVEKLLQRVGRIKATGDVAAARQLIDYYVKGKGHPLVQEKHIAAELLKYPKATFIYSVVY